MKNLILCISFLFLCVSLHARVDELDNLLSKLDSLIAHRDDFTADKESKIQELRKRYLNTRTQEELYWLNKMFYDEYYVYDADSALAYVDRNLDIAQQLHKPEWQVEWKIKKSFVLSATGLLKEALDELNGVSGSLLAPELKTAYYGQMVYLYSHFGQYLGDNSINRDTYADKEGLYTDSIYATITPQDPLYLWYKGWMYLEIDDRSEVKKELIDKVQSSGFDNRIDAMNAYILAHLCKADGQEEEFLKYIIYSAMTDVRTSNKDIASLEELGKAMFNAGDIDRAYTYINYCLLDAQMYHNRVRVLGISAVQNEIHQAYQERNVRQQARLHVFLILVSILSVILLVAIFYIYRQMRRISHSETQLNKANHLLNQHVGELSVAHQQLADVNNRLQALNEDLKEANNELNESNYVKEEYIGYVFTLCSNYISKLDEYRKLINRKIKAKQIDDVKALTDTPSMAQNELKEFYHNFDAIFLHVYPNFVSDFNSLLQPEEQIKLKEGELLNTELRIYALVRLGINDSVKIAEFLHCSAQTVYNNRLKTRNKAIIPKEDFARMVRSLGKMQS